MTLDFPPTSADQIHVTEGDNASLYVARQAQAIYTGATTPHIGVQWVPADSGLDAVAVRDLIGDPRNPDVLYAGVFSPRQWSVFVTRNRGQDWQLLVRRPKSSGTMILCLWL